MSYTTVLFFFSSQLLTLCIPFCDQISDTNRIPTIKDAQDHLYNDHFEGSDAFLSGPWLRKLVYYNDLRVSAALILLVER